MSATAELLRDYRRIGDLEECPVCGHKGWCLVARDGSAAIRANTLDDALLPQLADAGCAERHATRLAKGGQEHRDQNRDNRDDDQQLDQREA